MEKERRGLRGRGGKEEGSREEQGRGEEWGSVDGEWLREDGEGGEFLMKGPNMILVENKPEWSDIKGKKWEIWPNTKEKKEFH